MKLSQFVVIFVRVDHGAVGTDHAARPLAAGAAGEGDHAALSVCDTVLTRLVPRDAREHGEDIARIRAGEELVKDDRPPHAAEIARCLNGRRPLAHDDDRYDGQKIVVGQARDRSNRYFLCLAVG